MSELVLHFTDATALGGAERMILTLLAALPRRRWRPVLVHPADPVMAPLAAEALSLGLETRAVGRLHGKRGVPRLLRFARQVRAARPRVFHAHLSWPGACRHGILAAALAGVPGIVATLQLFTPLPKPRSIVLALASRAVQRYIAVSHGAAAAFAEGWAVSQAKIRVIPNAVPVDGFDAGRDPGLRAALTGGRSRPIALTLARLDPQKGLPYLVQAAAELPSVQFVLAGEGSERSALEADIRALGLQDRVRLLGQRDDAAALLDACDVFVLPSLFEGLPVSVLEAMAAGKPVVATAVVGTTEAVVDGVTGLLVAPRDPTALARAISRLLGDPPLSRRLGAAGRARVEQHFSADVLARRVSELYDEILGAGAPASVRA
jgi:glycosyltransferase involved in cell wall biosynthesis